MTVPVAAPPTEPRASALRALVDPFSRFDPGVTAALAVLAVVLGLAAARAGVRFDGALDTHVADGPVPLGTALADQIVALLVPALVGWGALRAVGARARLTRVVAALGAARLALVLTSPLVLFLSGTFPPELWAAPAPGAPPPIPPPGVLGVVLLVTAMSVWFVVLAVAGLRAAGGVRGGRLVTVSTAALLGGEVVSKLLLSALGLAHLG